MPRAPRSSSSSPSSTRTTTCSTSIPRSRSIVMMNIIITGATGALGAGVVAHLLGREATLHVPIVEAAVPAHAPWRGDARIHVTPNVSLDNEAQVAAFYASVPDLW